jgi:hypothetical protein
MEVIEKPPALLGSGPRRADGGRGKQQTQYQAVQKHQAQVTNPARSLRVRERPPPRNQLPGGYRREHAEKEAQSNRDLVRRDPRRLVYHFLHLHQRKRAIS